MHFKSFLDEISKLWESWLQPTLQISMSRRHISSCGQCTLILRRRLKLTSVFHARDRGGARGRRRSLFLVQMTRWWTHLKIPLKRFERGEGTLERLVKRCVWVLSPAPGEWWVGRRAGSHQLQDVANRYSEEQTLEVALNPRFLTSPPLRFHSRHPTWPRWGG